MQMLYLFIALLILAGLFYLLFVSAKMQGKADYRRKQAAQQLALRMTPHYRMMEEQDRAFLLAKERQAHEQALQWQEFQLKRHLMLTWREVSQYGLLKIDQDTNELTHIAPVHKPMLLKAGDAGAVASDIVRPTIDEIVQFLPHNSLKTCLGRSLNTQELIQADLDEAHLKLIGGTRMGKSTEAAALIDIACQTHDPDRLQIAILDLEDKTGRLFEHDPHIMMGNNGFRKFKVHARSVEQVAFSLIYLHAVMEQRYDLKPKALAKLPHILVYFEEFLYWKRILKMKVNQDTREQALTAFTGLATRSLKANIHLMACAQVDYRDEELVEAMSQFIGVNVAFSVKPSAAQAAGFVDVELLKRNYADRTPGQFVVEQVGGSDLGVAPFYDLKSRLAALDTDEEDESLDGQISEQEQHFQGHTVVSEDEPQTDALELPETRPNHARTMPRTTLDSALLAKVEQMMEIPGESMKDCIFRVWGARSGDSPAYRAAKQEYITCLEYIHALARQAMKEDA